MSMEALTSVSGNSYPAPEIPKIQPVVTQKQEEINSEVKAEGSKEVGEQAFDKVIERLKKMMSHKNIAIDNYTDTETGVQQIVFRDTETGKIIRQMPTDAVVEMVNKVVKELDARLFDKSV